MLIQIQRKRLVKSTLVLALVLKSFDSLALPSLAKQSDNLGLQSSDLATLATSSSTQAASGQCSPLSLKGGLGESTTVASVDPSASVLAQAAPPAAGGSCPADFTSIPCGTGSELFCEVGGVTADDTGGGLLAPLASAAGGLSPAVAGVAALAGIPLAFLGSGGGGGDTPPVTPITPTPPDITPTPPETPTEPVPEPSMIPAAALALGFILWNRRKQENSRAAVTTQNQELS